ncbi:MAG: hypothetical protein M3Z41_03240 [Candidatus Eremiobacteraeota bacterium]|nr:hypothetical protein [Candidatus Eremiobacteraeota bacterium]
MTWLMSGLKQVYGLFVDDGALSLAICVWLLVVWFVFPYIIASGSVRPIVLFIGLAALLVDSVRRGSTQRGKPGS